MWVDPAVVPDYPFSMDWHTSFTQGTGVTPAADPSRFADGIEGDSPSATPPPNCDNNSISDVLHWGQAWQVGDSSPGAGQRVQTDYIQKRLGTAVHTFIVSPPQ